MAGQRTFFSKDHERLLNIAAWAKYLAWVVLVLFVLWAVANLFAGISRISMQLSQFGQALSLSQIFRQYPIGAISIVLGAVGILFKGVVYYLVLTGISLGLNMIVETDVNSREKTEAAL